LDAGLYFSVIKDDLFKIDVPIHFSPKRFDQEKILRKALKISSPFQNA